MSGILIPCQSDAALPEFMALCIRQQDVGPSQEGFQFRDPKNDTNNLVLQLCIE